MSKIKIMALRHSAFYSPLLMTMAGGFLKQFGLEYEYQLETPANTVADNIRSGQCQLAQSAVATSFAELENQKTPDIVHFAQINKRDGFYIAGREKDDNFSWQKLMTKQILVDHFFQPLAMFKFALHKQGIEYSTIDVIDVGDVDAIEQAFRNGAADYVHMQGPLPQQFEHEGIGHVVAAVGDTVGDVAFSSLCASREWLETGEARAFIQAYRMAQKYVLQAPAEEIAAAELEAGFFSSIHPDVLKQTIAAYQVLGCWTDESQISRQSYENLLDVFSYAGAIHKRHAYELSIVQPAE